MKDVEILPDKDTLGRAAAQLVASLIRDQLGDRDKLRIIFAAAPSQTETLAHLVAAGGIDWKRIEAFHMDEYLGLPADHPARFANWLDAHLFKQVPFGRVNRIEPGDNPAGTVADYTALLQQAPIDLVLCGIGETGHIAFNDPDVADFNDAASVKIVTLDERSRSQQVDEGCFSSLDEVPKQAITITIPPLMSAKTVICVVSGAHKRGAVTAALTGPVTTACPASILTTHPDVHFFLDEEAGADVQP